MSLQGLKARTRTIAVVRSFLAGHGFVELEPQLFSSHDLFEPTIYPFKTNSFYLPTSPEAFLKKSMAAGLGNCFAISHAFRNLEGSGPLHAPEFIMAEWYQHQAAYQDMMRLTQELVGSFFSFSADPWPRLSWFDLWQQHLQADLLELLDDEPMAHFAAHRGYTTVGATWEQLFHQLSFNEIEPHFSPQPFFIIDYPARISPLAKPRPDAPQFAQRFELFIDKVELANGNTENFDTPTIEAVMRQERAQRAPSAQLDRQFLDALATLHSQQWAGVGLGIDRLTMLAGHFDHIRDVQTV